MFGSQALETAIGLALLFFILALAASQIVELLSRTVQKRAKDLERAIGGLLVGSVNANGKPKGHEEALREFRGTVVYDAVMAGCGPTLIRRSQRKPSYMSAKLFADAAVELLVDEADNNKLKDDLDKTVPGLVRLVTPVLRSGEASVLKVKVHLERTFDEVMDRAEGAYKRWVTLVLFIVGLLVAFSVNASAYDVARDLWKDPVTRATVTAAASNAVGAGGGADKIKSVADASETLTQLSLPVGWSQKHKCKFWNQGCVAPEKPGGVLSHAATIAGWLVTALLLMLGAPFWFDLLARLTSLRSSGTKPKLAGDDPLSATSKAAADSTALP